MTFTDAAGNGATSSEITYYWGTEGYSAVLPANRLITDSRLANGNSYSISVFARSTVNGISSPFGPAVSAAAVVPYGPPHPPQVSASGGVNSVTLSWNAGSSGNGRPIVEVQIETTDGGLQSVGISGSISQGNGRNQTKSIRARAKDSTGVWSGLSGWASASTWGSPSYWATLGTYVEVSLPSFCSTANGGCYRQNIYLRSFNPDSSVYCWVGGINAKDWWGTITVDGAGNRDWVPANSSAMGYLYANDASAVGATCEQR